MPDDRLHYYEKPVHLWACLLFEKVIHKEQVFNS